MKNIPPLILASTSTYRQMLLKRLGLAFTVEAPGVEEFSLEFEAPAATALRLAQEKAFAVSARFPDALVIGSDQVACCANERLSKPGTAARALEQLRLQRGRVSEFHTAICVMRNAGHEFLSEIVTTRVRFRSAKELTDERLRAYIEIEQPMDCAGAAKSEGLGISLIESMDGPDPTALVGLPLIALTKLLRKMGVDPLQAG
jgi:septum formation protein